MRSFVLAVAACALAACSSAASSEKDGGTADTAVLEDASSADALAPDAGAPDAAAPDASSSPDAAPRPPRGLVEYVTGDPADHPGPAQGPGLIIMGGGTDVDDAFRWQRDRIGGGDIVILRTSGADGYNDYLYTTIGGADSVHTMLVTTRAFADHPYVADKIAAAEAIFLAGGDQSTYVDNWKSTGVERAILLAWSRGAIVGGTSAGAAVLGDFIFGAHNGGVTSDEVLADPYDPLVTLDRDFFGFAPLEGIITDTHFRERDRIGRLAGFLARIVKDGWRASAIGLGVGEQTAVVVGPQGDGTVLGLGDVYVLHADAIPETCTRGQALTYRNIRYAHLMSGDTIQLPSAVTTTATRAMSIEAGVISPLDPY